MNGGGSRARGSATVTIAVMTVLVATAGVAAAAGSTTVSITPRTDGIGVGETTTFRVMVDDAHGGVGAGEIRIAVDDPDVAAITNVTVLGTGEQGIDVTDDGSSADVRYAFRDTADTGAVPVIEVTVEGRTEGGTGLSLGPAEGNDDVIVFDEEGTGYEVTGTDGADLTVGAGGATPGGDSGRDGSGGSGGSDGDASGEIEIVGGSLLNETVTAGAGVVARVHLTNDDPVRGTVALSLTANGSAVTERSVAVGASTERTVSLRHEFDRPGTYDVSVNGVPLGVVSVTAGSTPTPTATATSTPAIGPTTAAPTAATDDAVTTTGTERPGTVGDQDRSPSARDGSGFGPLVAVLSVLAGGLLLRRV